MRQALPALRNANGELIKRQFARMHRMHARRALAAERQAKAADQLKPWRQEEMSETKFYASREYGSRINIYVVSGEYIGQPLTMVKHDEGAIVDPIIRIDSHEAQQLMDELWTCGLRPSEGTGSAGQSAAQQKHIDDLREIAFKVLKIEDKK